MTVTHPVIGRIQRIALTVAVAVVLAIAAVSASVLWLRSGHGFESTDNAYIRNDISIISPRVDGYVEQVFVDDNQRVAKGAPLVHLDTDRRQAELARAQAAVAQRQAAVQNHEAEIRQQRSEVIAATAHIETATATTARVQQDIARSGALVDKGWTSKQAHEDNLARLAIATSELRETRARTNVEHERLRVLRTQADTVLAALKSARADLRLAEIALADATIHAPVDGTVGNRRVQPGEYVRKGTELMALVPLDGLWIEANFKETQINLMRPGQPADLRVDSLNGEILCGHIDSLAPASGDEFALIPADNATGNFTKVVRRITAKLVFDDGHPRVADLKAGMSVVVTVRTAQDAEPALPAFLEPLLGPLGIHQRGPCFQDASN